MRIVMTGASGLIGSALGASLAASGHQVLRLVRRAPRGPSEARWEPESGFIERQALEGVEAAVHLAGESIASGRWTRERKARIRESRLRGTRLLCETLAGLAEPPRVLASTSAIGYYGDRGDEVLNERSRPGRGFLPDLSREWEAATHAADARGIRVVVLRVGLVLSSRGGTLAALLPLFRFGLGGPIAGGRAWWSWIAIDDLVGIYRFATENGAMRGVFNAVSPAPVTNREFTRTLARVLSRPAVLPVPALALRLRFGELADEALLASTRVVPERLLQSGYDFGHPDLEGALRWVLRGGPSESNRARGS